MLPRSRCSGSEHALRRLICAARRNATGNSSPQMAHWARRAVPNSRFRRLACSPRSSVPRGRLRSPSNVMPAPSSAAEGLIANDRGRASCPGPGQGEQDRADERAAVADLARGGS